VVSETVKQFFAELESKVDPAKTAGMNNSYVFDVDGAGQWTVRVNDGQVKVNEGVEQADVTISASADTFERIAKGQQNPTTAYMTGKLKVKGDMSAAMKLQKLF
jgi:putative sterol carrier protein